MDLLDLIITIAILAGGALLSGGKKKTSDKKARPVTTSQKDDGTLSDVWQSLMGVEEEVKTPTKSNKKNRTKTSAEASSYFSYENQPVDWNKKESVPSDMPQNRVFQEETPAPINFDLRQAFIYQTILQNDYISEMK